VLLQLCYNVHGSSNVVLQWCSLATLGAHVTATVFQMCEIGGTLVVQCSYSCDSGVTVVFPWCGRDISVVLKRFSKLYKLELYK
jgi:hypothetical protein